jgi:hypothetical protein
MDEQVENLVQSESIGPTSYPMDERAPMESEDESAEPMTFSREGLLSAGYEIRISPISYGFIVKVGCQTVAVEEAKTLANALSAYLLNPVDFEKDWNKTKNLDKYK